MGYILISMPFTVQQSGKFRLYCASCMHQIDCFYNFSEINIFIHHSFFIDLLWDMKWTLSVKKRLEILKELFSILISRQNKHFFFRFKLELYFRYNSVCFLYLSFFNTLVYTAVEVVFSLFNYYTNWIFQHRNDWFTCLLNRCRPYRAKVWKPKYAYQCRVCV